MSRNENQKLKLYYLYRLMLEKTDDEHGLTMPEIIDALEANGITAERKSIYRDLETIDEKMDIEILKDQQGKQFFYHVGAKQFELAELKLLVDSVQASKFITERKSSELIKKITALGSVYEANQLKRQVHVQGRIKTMNESIYYNVDEIHTAIAQNHSIVFCYMSWDVNGKLVPRKYENGKTKFYEISPWALSWYDENYYLIAFDHADQKIKHYRVDKISNIKITDRPREGKEEFRNFDPAAYSKKNFGMFSGEEVKVHIQFPESFVGIFFDRFGKDITVHKTKKEGFYETVVGVAISEQFFGWVTALGPQVTITGPEKVVDEYKKELKAILKNY